MSVHTLSVRQLRPIISSVLDKIYRKWDRYIIVKHGKPEAIMMSIDDYESMIETLNIQADKECMKRIRLAEKALKKNKGKTLEDIHQGLGIV